MSRSRKQRPAQAQKQRKVTDLEARALGPRAAGQVKGGAGPASKPVARYHLEHAWPLK